VYDAFARYFDVKDSPGRDFALVVGGRPIYCHRVILALRSSHFRNLFSPSNKAAPPASMRFIFSLTTCCFSLRESLVAIISFQLADDFVVVRLLCCFMRTVSLV
jgi:hypothetical protein